MKEEIRPSMKYLNAVGGATLLDVLTSDRVVVTDAYQRRCAITGEKTLPVLQATHIKPYSEKGPHSIDNGLLLRSDFHTLLVKRPMVISDDLVMVGFKEVEWEERLK